MAVVNMPIEYLVPHPQNPRKDLGDLEELTASIKENGIYQNLTVIPINEEAPDEEPKYMVVIGHRRLEAARRAERGAVCYRKRFVGNAAAADYAVGEYAA